jgi:hypothetical protein
MDRRSLLLISALGLAISASAAVSFYRYVIVQNFEIFIEVAEPGAEGGAAENEL